MIAVLASFVVLGLIVGAMFWQFMVSERKHDRAAIETKTDATDRMARIAHRLGTFDHEREAADARQSTLGGLPRS